METDAMDVEKICRSCMSQTEADMQNVYDSQRMFGEETVHLVDMLTFCTSLTVRCGDGLPSMLCPRCVDRLQHAYEFRQQCLKSDTTLRQQFAKDDEEQLVVQPDLSSMTRSDESSNSEWEGETPQRNKSVGAKPQFPCRQCHKVLRSKRDLAIHQRRHTGDKLRACQICCATYTRTHHLVRHMKTHMDAVSDEYVCPHCKQQYEKMSSLMDHIKEEHPEEYKQSMSSSVDGGGGGQESGGEEDAAEEDDEKDDKLKWACQRTDSDADLDGHSGPTTRQQRRNAKGVFTCKVCGKIMTTFVGLRIHMRRHTGFDLSQCQYCDKSFTKRSHLKRHLLTHGINNEKTTDKPKSSTSTPSTTATVTASPARSTDKKILDCEFCDRKFKYPKSFNHHLKSEHGISEPEEEADDEKPPHHRNRKAQKRSATTTTTSHLDDTTTNDDYDDNNKSSDDDDDGAGVQSAGGAPTTKRIRVSSRARTHQCHVCNFGFTRSNHLVRHMNIHRDVLVHKCDQCEKAYATAEHLAKHVTDNHTGRPYVCTTCDKPFKRGEHLIRHLKVHEKLKDDEDGGRVHACSVCEKRFQRSDHLARHLKSHLSQDRRHVCGQCGKTFTRPDNLRTHERIHTGEKDTNKLHLCIYCGKEFNNSSNLIVHMRRHTGERPYKCKYCDKGFPRSHDLKCHERTHSGEKPYQCSVCGKSFNKSNKLLRHTRVHTGERPYVCNLCGRAFTQSNDLTLHMRRHTGARPYACGVCPARFIQSGQLKAHKRSSGHWVDTAPDLKGGYRVEPVQTKIQMPPVRFKSYTPASALSAPPLVDGIPGKEEGEIMDEDDHTKPSGIHLPTTTTTGTPVSEVASAAPLSSTNSDGPMQQQQQLLLPVVKYESNASMVDGGMQMPLPLLPPHFTTDTGLAAAGVFMPPTGLLPPTSGNYNYPAFT